METTWRREVECAKCGHAESVLEGEAPPDECPRCAEKATAKAAAEPRTAADVAWDAINWFGSAVTTLASASRSMKRAGCEDWRTFDKHARDMYEAHGRLLADRRALAADGDVGCAARRAASVDLDEIARALDLSPDRDLPAAVRRVRDERNAAREARVEALRQRDRCAQEAAEARAERDRAIAQADRVVDGLEPRVGRLERELAAARQDRDEAEAVARETLDELWRVAGAMRAAARRGDSTWVGLAELTARETDESRARLTARLDALGTGAAPAAEAWAEGLPAEVRTAIGDARAYGNGHSDENCDGVPWRVERKGSAIIVLRQGSLSRLLRVAADGTITQEVPCPSA